MILLMTGLAGLFLITTALDKIMAIYYFFLNQSNTLGYI